VSVVSGEERSPNSRSDHRRPDPRAPRGMWALIVFVGLCASVTSALFVLRLPDHVAGADQSAPAVALVDIKQEPQSPAAAAVQKQAPAVDKPTPTVLDRYQAQRDMREFVIRAISDPSHGAALYALRVIGECDALALFPKVEDYSSPGDSLDPDSQTSALLRISASNSLKTRCSGLLTSESKEFAARLMKAGAESQDPIYQSKAAIATALPSGSPSQRRRALVDAFTTKDPIVFDSIGMRLGLYAGDPSTGPEFKFQQEVHAIRTDSDILWAVQLLPCGLGLRCDEKEGQTALRCARGLDCFAGRFDALENGVLKDDPERYQRVVTMYRRMLASIQAGNVDDFLK
jgi:hypothetical protein